LAFHLQIDADTDPAYYFDVDPDPVHSTGRDHSDNAAPDMKITVLVVQLLQKRLEAPCCIDCHYVLMTRMLIWILLVTLMLIRILPFTLMRIRIRILTVKLSLKTLAHILYIWACHLQIDADPDPAFHFDADPDPQPAYHFDADPDPVHITGRDY
jgi:hypothetical protein